MSIKEDKPHECYNCQNYKLCHVRHAMQDFIIKHADMLENTILPPITKAIRCLAGMCKEYEPVDIVEGTDA